GIEALSRGARKAYFIENSPKALSCIQENLVFTKFQDRAIVLKQDACAAIGCIFEKEVDIIFMDPPYGQGLERNILSLLSAVKYVTSDTLIIV
ncbi:MAG: RsmD family RNA methyltransferase, partial [Lachnospiraceae bacterium]|nr:RsmD family RNA methyltransferase [Lachnospiraceae bacterium]